MRRNPTDKIIERLEPEPAKEDPTDYCTADLEWFGLSNLTLRKAEAIMWLGKLLDFWREQHAEAMTGPMTAAQREKIQRAVRHMDKLEQLKHEVKLSEERTVELPNRLFAETNFRVNPSKAVPAPKRSRKPLSKSSLD